MGNPVHSESVLLPALPLIPAIITYEDPITEETYANYQAYGFFALGVGVPAVISSIGLGQYPRKISNGSVKMFDADTETSITG